MLLLLLSIMLLLALHHAAESANYFAVKVLTHSRSPIDSQNNEVSLVQLIVNSSLSFYSTPPPLPPLGKDTL